MVDARNPAAPEVFHLPESSEDADFVVDGAESELAVDVFDKNGGVKVSRASSAPEDAGDALAAQQREASSLTPHPEAPKDALLLRVEEAMSAGLEETYRAMTPDQQNALKSGGEAAATQIRVMLAQGQMQPRRVRRVLETWLTRVPRVNRYWALQQAKVAADKITDLKGASSRETP